LFVTRQTLLGNEKTTITRVRYARKIKNILVTNERKEKNEKKKINQKSLVSLILTHYYHIPTSTRGDCSWKHEDGSNREAVKGNKSSASVFLQYKSKGPELTPSVCPHAATAISEE